MMTQKNNHQRLPRAIMFGALLLTGSVLAFTHPPPARFRAAAMRGFGVTRIGMKRGSSDSNDSTSTSKSRKRERQPKAFGWTKPAGPRRAQGAGSAAPPQEKVDWSKLFATPEPEPAPRSRPLTVLSRRFACVAQGSLYASPLFLFFSALLLIPTSSPSAGLKTVGAWGLGRLAFGLSMRGEDVSRRMPVGFVGYASLFLIVGGVAFMNGLKAVSNLGLVM
ncbi:unnamed protein product [Scytosiphon promiscuus]